MRKKWIGIVSGVLVTLIALGVWLSGGRAQQAMPQQSSSPGASPTANLSTSPAPSSMSASPTPEPSPSSSDPASDPTATPTPVAADLADCQPLGKGFTPKRFSISRVGADEKVVPMGLTKGAIPAPPLSDRRSAAWWKEGPKPGSGTGKAVFTIHTYRPSLAPALGNELFQGGESQLKPGDIFKVYGTKGEVACYEYEEAPKITLDEYEENSSLMLDSSGPASATIVICWDFNKRTKNWDSRVLFQFRGVNP